MKKNQEITVYSYLIDVLTSINLVKTYEELGAKSDALDKLKSKTLDLIGDFEKFDNFDPRANIGLTIKVIIKNGSKILLEKKGNEYHLLSFAPALIGSIEEEICASLGKIVELRDVKPLLKAFINLNELIKESKKPEYCAVYEIVLKDEVNVLKKNYSFVNIDEVNELDKFILERTK